MRRGVDGETELGFLSIVDGKSFEEEGSQSGTSTTTDGVEHKEALETSAVVSELSDSVKAEIDNFFSDGVVSSGEVVGGIFLSGDELLGVEELSVGSGSDLIDDGGFEIEEDATGDVLSSSSFGEEGVEGIVATTDSLVGGHLAIRLNSVLQAEQLPAGVTDLNTSLTNVNGDNFSHDETSINITSTQFEKHKYIKEVRLPFLPFFISNSNKIINKKFHSPSTHQKHPQNHELSPKKSLKTVLAFYLSFCSFCLPLIENLNLKKLNILLLVTEIG